MTRRRNIRKTSTRVYRMSRTIHFLLFTCLVFIAAPLSGGGAAAEQGRMQKEFLETYELHKYLPSFDQDPDEDAADDRAVCLGAANGSHEIWKILSACTGYEHYLRNDGPCSVFMNIRMCEGDEAVARDYELSAVYLKIGQLYRLPGEYNDLDASIANFTRAVDLSYRQVVEFAQTQRLKVPGLEALLERARTYAAMGDLDLADQDLDILLDTWPEHPVPWFEKARIALSRNNFEQSVGFLDKAISRHAQFAQAYYLRAYANQKLGHRKQAFDDCSRAERLDSTLHCKN